MGRRAIYIYDFKDDYMIGKISKKDESLVCSEISWPTDTPASESVWALGTAMSVKLTAKRSSWNYDPPLKFCFTYANYYINLSRDL